MANRRRRIGLRARVISSFGLFSLLLALGLSGAAFFLVQVSTLERRENTATRQAFTNARFVRTQVMTTTDGIGKVNRDDLLRRGPVDGSAVLVIGNQVIASAFDVGGVALNPEKALGAPPVGGAGNDTEQGKLYDLAAAVRDEREPVLQRLHVRGAPMLVVGIPIEILPQTQTQTGADATTTTTAPDPATTASSSVAAPDANAGNWAQYYEISSLGDIETTFNRLVVALLIADGLTVLVGLFVGRWVSKRVLAPLSDVNAAVEALAEMSFDTKLPATRDPDLAPLVSTFNHTVAALHERIERDGRFASDVSHELRSPLTTLTNSVAVLERYNDNLPEPAQQAVSLLSVEFERFQQLVSDLLEISRFDAGAQRLERSPLIVGEFVRHAIRMTCPDQDIPVTIDPDLEEAVIMADKRRLVQVLQNLSVNAAKYAGGVTEVTVVRARGGVEIAIVDSGPGVPLEDRIRVFDRFARGVTANKRGSDTGTGLGLSLVAEHMRLHNGTVRVEDRLDGAPGARFVVYLPATPVSIYDTEADFEAAGIGADL